MTAPLTARPEEHAAHRRPVALDMVAALLLVGAVVLHVVAIFPKYIGVPLTSSSDTAAGFAVLAAGWAVALAVGLTGPHRTPVAAGLAVGLAVTEFGFRVYEVGGVLRYGVDRSGVGPGMWLMLAGWACGAAAAAVAVRAARARHSERTEPDEDPNERLAWTVLVTVLGAIVAAAFLPSWDHAIATNAATGQTKTVALGAAFSGVPWEQSIGTVITTLVLLVLPALAIRRPDRSAGAGLVVGALVVLSSQFVSYVLLVDEPVPASTFGLTSAQVHQFGLELTLRLTYWFAVDAVAAFALFAAVIVRATLREDQANSVGTSPMAP